MPFEDLDAIGLAEVLMNAIYSQPESLIWEYESLTRLLELVAGAVEEIAARRALTLAEIRQPGETLAALSRRVPGLTRERAADLLCHAAQIMAEEPE